MESRVTLTPPGVKISGKIDGFGSQNAGQVGKNKEGSGGAEYGLREVGQSVDRSVKLGY